MGFQYAADVKKLVVRRAPDVSNKEMAAIIKKRNDPSVGFPGGRFLSEDDRLYVEQFEPDYFNSKATRNAITKDQTPYFRQQPDTGIYEETTPELEKIRADIAALEASETDKEQQKRRGVQRRADATLRGTLLGGFTGVGSPSTYKRTLGGA